MIAEALALLLGSPAPAVKPPYVVEARYRHRHGYRRRRATRVPLPLPVGDVAPKKVTTQTIIEDESGRYVVIRSGPKGIEDVYSRVPPFNRSRP
jgi:hypothetical protein